MRWAMIVEYDGSGFCGWQAQEDHQRTVQAELELALSKVASHRISTICAGRTDAGVHAKGQVIHFDTTSNRSAYAWMMGANSHLPKDISVHHACQMPDDFHARYSALARTYRYYIDNSRARPAIMRQHITWHKYPLDIKLMQIAGESLLGEHDFSAFRGKDCQAKSPMRCLQKIAFFYENNQIVMEIRANAFLHHMVRNIVGVLLPIGSGRRPVSWAKEVLLSYDRTQAGVTAPANGLYLQEVLYPEKFAILLDWQGLQNR